LNGSSDYLTWSGSTVGTSQFTFECWFYYTGTFASVAAFCGPGSAVTNSLNLYIANSTTFTFDQYGIAGTNFTVPTMTANQWYHVAFVRGASNACTVFLNGVRSSTGTVAVSTNFVSIASIGYVSSAVPRYFSGYLSNIRYTTAAVYDPTATTITVPTQLFPVTSTQLLTCQSPTLLDNSTNNFTITAVSGAKVSNFTPFAGYQGFNPALGAAAGGVWTLDEAAYYQQNRIWPIYDPYFNQTTLMLHGNGTNGAQNNTFLDSSTNNFTITRNGNTTQGSFTPFSQTGWSNNFSSSYLSISATLISTTATTFTMEGWIYMTATPVSSSNIPGLCGDMLGSAGTNYMSFGPLANLTLGFQWNNGTTNVTAAGNSVMSLNTWYHVAISVNSNAIKMFVNGVQQTITGTSTLTNRGGTTSTFTIAYNSTQAGVTGYVSNIRVTNTAVYTSSFTPSTAPLTATTGTLLLTCQSNRFVDSSANNYAITATSSPSVQAFSPFVPAYITPTTYSNFFDGTGDYLTASGANLALGAGNFTVEGYVYLTGYNGGAAAYSGIGSYPDSTALMFYINASGGYAVNVGASDIITTGTAPLNTWIHFAIVRSSTGSNGLTLYINGISVATATSATNFTSTNAVIGRTGVSTNSNLMLGCLSNIRVIVGTALYTAAFTPPTAPLTAISGTSILTSVISGAYLADNSGNAFTFTNTGSTAWNSASPFTGTGYKNRVYTWTSSGSITF
jgi:hypothetical protein